MKRFYLIIFSCGALSSVYSQGREVVNSREINVFADYGGKSPERPGPSREIGRAGTEGADRNIKKSTTELSNQRKTSILINEESFTISKDSEDRLKEFLEIYRTNGNVGQFVAAVASIYSLFDLFNIDSESSTVDAIFKLKSFNSEEVLIKLSSPSIWNRAWRAQAASYCEAEMGLAISKGQDKDAQMWLRIRDIIANPNRYKDGGIQLKKDLNKLMLRSFPAEAYRGLAGFEENLTDLDIKELGILTNNLIFYTKSRDYIIYADYIYDLNSPAKSFKKLTMRDKIFLNKSLITLDSESKKYFRNVFLSNSRNVNMTRNFWVTLRNYLDTESWNNGFALDSEVDNLGFMMNELPEHSDLVWGNYPMTPIFSKTPKAWVIPLSTRQDIYYFYYSDHQK